MLTANLWLERGDTRSVVARLERKPLTLGRAPVNDVVFPDEDVSWQHASVWTERGAVWVRDLGSRNGTEVNGERITAPRALADGDLLSLAGVRLRVEIPLPPHVFLDAVVEDVDLGVRYPFRMDRFVFGSGPTADLPVQGPLVAATLLTPGGDECWLGVDGEDRLLASGEVFEVAGRRFRVVAVESGRAPTVDRARSRYPYRLEVTLSGPRGPAAVLHDPTTDRRHAVEADNRAVLLFILGRQVQSDADGGVDPAECGWIGDDEATTGVWGRAQASRDVNGLHVLVHRVRRELAEAGFDPWFIEKRRRCIRARVASVTVR